MSREHEIEKPKKKNRCAICNVKVGLLGFDCRCGGKFCGKHRHADDHECSFEYKLMHQKKLESDLTVVGPQKISEI